MVRTLAVIVFLSGCFPAAQAQPAARGSAQTYPADTLRITALLRHAEHLLYKPGEDPADLDSALRLTQQATTLSQTLGYTRGVQWATLLAATIDIEWRRYARAWGRYAALDDTGRVDFLGTMVRYRCAEATAPADSAALCDTLRRWAGLIQSYWGSIRSVNCITYGYLAVAASYDYNGNAARAMAVRREAWQRVRQFGDIAAESGFVWQESIWGAADSASIRVTLSIVDQLADDGARLLAGAGDSAQRLAINSLATMGLNYFALPHSSAFEHILSVAIGLDRRLHQHDALPFLFLSYCYYNQGRTKEALAVALDGVRISETPAGAADGFGYEGAARTYHAMGESDRALDYFDKALPLFQKDPSLVYAPSTLFQIPIDILLDKRQPDRALRLLRVLRAVSVTHSGVFYEKQAFAIASGNCFAALRQNDSAEYYFKQAIAYAPSGAFYLRAASCYALAGFYVKTGQYARAKPLLARLTDDSSRQARELVRLGNSFFLRYQVDSALGDDHQAVIHLRQYQAIHDSIVNVAKTNQLAEMSIRYETEKKTQHIADLEKQNILQTQLRQSADHRNRLVRDSLIAGAFLLALLAVVLYNRYRIRRRLSVQLQKLLGEKEWLLREIHHRVKNNLQIIISLLNMQSGQLKDEMAISAFEQIGARVNTISLVHKKLYQETQDLATIDMREYIGELTGYLQDSFASLSGSVCGRPAIRFQFDIAELSLDVAQCVPLGLILNEAVTNAIKYAFPADSAPDDPTITITLKEEVEDWITLTVADNGIGLPPDFDPESAQSLGLRLIRILTTQLDGELTIHPLASRGFSLLVRFPYAEPMG